MTTTEILAIVTVVILLANLYFYMYTRMKTMIEAQEKGTYEINVKRSLIELIVFMIIYCSCSALSVVPEFSLSTTLIGGLLAFLLSTIVINKFLYLKLGKWMFVYATTLMLAYYSTIATIYYY